MTSRQYSADDDSTTQPDPRSGYPSSYDPGPESTTDLPPPALDAPPCVKRPPARPGDIRRDHSPAASRAFRRRTRERVYPDGRRTYYCPETRMVVTTAPGWEPITYYADLLSPADRERLGVDQAPLPEKMEWSWWDYALARVEAWWSGPGARWMTVAIFLFVMGCVGWVWWAHHAPTAAAPEVVWNGWYAR